MKRLRTFCCLSVSLIVGLSACSDGDSGAPLSPNRVEVTGTLVTLEDLVPVDGGVTLEVQSDQGVRTAFHIPSFFTSQPVPAERWELYQHVKTFSIGDSVDATGEPTEHGLILVTLVRVDRL